MKSVVDILEEPGPLDRKDRTSLIASQVLATLSGLELKRLVRRLPRGPSSSGLDCISELPGEVFLI